MPRLIASLKEFQDRGGEIILVDTGSVDGTPTIARELGLIVDEVGPKFVRTITQKQAYDINARRDKSEPQIVTIGDTLFDYASARNYAAAKASNDMIAMPDCDEIYTQFNIDLICSSIEAGINQFEYNFVFSHDEHGGELVKFMHSKFYNRTQLKWVGIIHEVLQCIEPDTSINKHFFDESIIKLEHFQNTETNRGGYLKGLALAMLEEPGNDRNAHYYGRELLYCNRPKSAIIELRRHIAMQKWPEERSQSFIHIGEAYLQLGQIQKGIHAFTDAFDVCPTRREPLMKIAEFYYTMGAGDHVIPYAMGALQIPSSNFYAAFQPYYEHYPHELLYWAFYKKGDIEQARIHWEKCIQYQPYNSKFLHDYRFFNDLPKVSIIIPTLREEDALDRTLDSIKKLNYPEELIEVIAIKDIPRIGVPKRVQEGLEKSTGEWIVYAADDMEFTPDSLIIAYLAALNMGTRFAAFNSGPLLPDEGNICEHFMIKKDLALEIGGIFDTDFHHVGVDNLLWGKMKKQGQDLRAEFARVIHHHFSHEGIEMDEVHKLGWDAKNVEEDRALLDKKLAEL